MEKEFSHLNQSGEPTMVDVTNKKASKRTAVAKSIVIVNEEILKQFEENDIKTKKGPVFQTAIIAGIMAAKRTGELIPLCHPLPIENCNISISLNTDNHIEILCEASIEAKTGVEMEALVGASLAALTIYDMCKAFSHDIVIAETRLIKKTGGKSDFFKP
jgi:cyclic pyranopterin phosphate synthase